MRPVFSDAVFGTNQRIVRSVEVFNTPHTVESMGMIYRPATALSTFGDSINFTTATRAQMDSHFDSHTQSSISSRSGTPQEGRIPVLYDYWGSGAPIGVRRPRATVMRVTGYVKNTGSYALALLGRGRAKVFINNVSVLFGQFDEKNPLYQTSLASLTQGDRVDIFYWNIEEPWGGFAVRVADNASAVSEEGIDWEYMREAPFLSASFMDDNSTVNSFNIVDFEGITINRRRGQVSDVNLTVVKAGSRASAGWQWDNVNKSLVDSLSGEEIRLGNLVKIEAGFLGDSPIVFTGSVSDIIANNDTYTLKIEDLSGRLATQLSENYPDRMSYAAFGYTNRSGISDPVWNTPAYDNWPYEYAVRDMLVRGWIDDSLTKSYTEVKRVGQTTSEQGSSRFRARDASGNHIRIKRQANYGNPDGSPDLPKDDEYLTSSNLTQTVYTRIQELVDRIGYDFSCAEDGSFNLRPKNNPSSTQSFTGGSSVTNASAIGGTYEVFTGTGWSASIQNIKASRIDLVVGRAPGLGTIQVDITRDEDGASFSTTINLDNNSEVLYYDNVYNIELDNITAFSVLSGELYGTYDLTITPLGGTGSTQYYLDAIRVYEMDPDNPTEYLTLSNYKNVTSISSKSNATERINDAVVTGKRVATITDSEKTRDSVETEFVISRSTDVNSILNPNSVNYFGRKITAFLSDESIGDQELADWTSRTLVTRYNNPNADANIEHTMIPMLEIGDPVYLKDETFGAFDENNVMWVVGYTHSTHSESAITRIELSAFPENPSYEPKEEIDLALYNNKPAINLNITYPSLSGFSWQTNPEDGLPVASDISTFTGTISGRTISGITGTPSPGSEVLYIERTSDSNEWGVDIGRRPADDYFKNNPYHKFYSLSGGTLTLDFEAGDGSSDYTTLSNWRIYDGKPYRFSFRPIIDAYSGNSPFYDPYYSELFVPELINVSFDALVSGYYRVSIVDARDKSNPITVAYLTNGSLDSEDDNDYWQYMTSGPGKLFTWDGVDNRGTWNRTQSEEYSWRQSGNFSEHENPLIGRGFYAFNDSSTGITHISDETDGGEVVYPLGQYAKFFVRIEAVRTNDELPLLVESNNENDLLDDSASTLSPRFIYYHLPQPNKVSISIEDWTGGSDYNPNSPTDNWGSLDDNATIRDGKPVKITISPKPRIGSKFSGDVSNSPVKVHRVVALNANINDLSAIHMGRPFNSLAGSPEEKRVVGRRFTVQDHSLIFADDGFAPRDGDEDWVFYPSLFKSDFGRGEESIEFLNYLQMSEVPYWNPSRQIGEERSRMVFAMMNYLFYFSVYTQDRSGRLVWAIDESFVDKSKITSNTSPTEFPHDLNRHQVRTIYTRQWWDSDELDQTNGPSGWQIPESLRGGYADKYDFHSTVSNALYPLNSGAYRSGTTITGNTDPISNEFRSKGLMEFYGSGDISRDLGSGNLASTSLGNWTWEDDGIRWVANPSRDFHPYYLIPPMGLASYEITEGYARQGKRRPWWRENYMYAITDHRGFGNLGDEAKFDSWFTIAPDYTVSDYSPYNMYPGDSLETEYKDSEGNDENVPSFMVYVQKQDDILCYEKCRGGFTNGAGGSRDLMNVIGGDPYYQNAKLYRYFRMRADLARSHVTRYYNDVWRMGWFYVTFRHTYNWESSSLFPIDRDKGLLTGAIDSDLTGAPISAYSFDPGGYTGWKDDHPSAMQQGPWPEGFSDCSTIHWRNDFNTFGTIKFASDVHGVPEAGGSCSLSNPSVALEDEVLEEDYTGGKNIFDQRKVVAGKQLEYEENGYNQVSKTYQPLAVGPRLPTTRRAIYGVSLENRRRNQGV